MAMPPPSAPYYPPPPRDPTAVVGRRIVAFVIDALIASAISGAAIAAMRSQTYSNAPNDGCALLRQARGFSGTCFQLGSHVYTWNGGRFFWMYVFWIGISFLNWVILQGLTGATVGKFVVGLRVINQQGEIAGIGRSFLRWLLLVVDYVACFLIGLISVSVTRPHRRVGDMVAGTDVVATADVGRPVLAPQPVPAYGGWTPRGEVPAGTPPGAMPPPYATQPPPVWGAPPAAAQPPSPWSAPQQTWGAPAPPPAPPAEDQPGWAQPATPAPRPAAPSSWGTPREPTTPTAPEPASSGESWWDRANDGDDEPNL